MTNSLRKSRVVLHEDCMAALDSSDFSSKIDLSFLDPPFNQDKAYNTWDDNLPPEKYWEWMRGICAKVYALTSDGGAIYFMQREKNTEFDLQCLRDAGWTFQNLIIWKKKTSADVSRFFKDYACTSGLEAIWGKTALPRKSTSSGKLVSKQTELFQSNLQSDDFT